MWLLITGFTFLYECGKSMQHSRDLIIEIRFMSLLKHVDILFRDIWISIDAEMFMGRRRNVAAFSVMVITQRMIMLELSSGISCNQKALRSELARQNDSKYCYTISATQKVILNAFVDADGVRGGCDECICKAVKHGIGI